MGYKEAVLPVNAGGTGAITASAARTSLGCGDVVGPASATDNALVRYDLTTGKLLKNGVITEDNTGNMSQSASVSGASLSVITANTSNTASATAYHEVQVAGGTASDAYFKADISGGQNWTWGLDNSDSDAFVLSANASLGTTNVMRVSTAGEISHPLQPAFFATQNGTVTNVTGDGTAYTIIYDLEVFDQNSDFNTTTGVFTAPVTGRYQLQFNILAQQATTAMSVTCALVTSNRTINAVNIGTAQAGNNTFAFAALVDMDAADTASVTVQLSAGAKVVDIYGTSTADPRTNFSGFLAA